MLDVIRLTGARLDVFTFCTFCTFSTHCYELNFLLGAGGRGLGYVNWVCGEFFWGGLWVQAGEGTRNWHVLSVARVLFFDLEMIEHLFAINLIEALHCRGGINKHTDMVR